MLRVIATVIAVFVIGFFEFANNTVGTLVVGKIAGSQFDASDVSYLQTQAIFGISGLIGNLIALAAVAIIAWIWWNPVKSLFAEANKELTD